MAKKTILTVATFSLLVLWSCSFAIEGEKPFVSFTSTYLDKTSKLLISSKVFEGAPKCNLDVSASKNKAIAFVKNDFGELDWTVQSIQILFSETSQAACIHIVDFLNRGDGQTSFLKVGVGMNGELIKPIVEPGLDFNRQ